MSTPRELRAGPVQGVVLAAGASTRAGCVKALATIEGEALVARAARVLRAGGCEEVVVVVGPPHAPRVRHAVEGVATAVSNPDPGRGMRSSLSLGLRDRFAAAVVSLVDHPSVCVRSVEQLIEAWRRSSAQVVRPVYDGRRGHPYVIGRAVFARVRQGDLSMDVRPVLAEFPGLDVPVRDAGVREDLDTARELSPVVDPAGEPATALSQT